MNPLVVPRVLPSSEHLEQLPETIGWVFVNSLLQARYDFVISSRVGLISIDRYANASKATSSALTEIESLHHEVN